MESIYDFMRRMYGNGYYLPSYDGKHTREKRTHSKHQGSKRGYAHKLRLSKGQQNHLKFVS